MSKESFPSGDKKGVAEGEVFTLQEQLTPAEQEKIIHLFESRANVIVKRSSGEFESDWKISDPDHPRQKVTVFSEKLGLMKAVPIKEFLEWQDSPQKNEQKTSITSEEFGGKISEVKTLEGLASLLNELKKIPLSDGGYVETRYVIVLINRLIEILNYTAPEAVLLKVEEFLNEVGSQFTRNGGLRQKVYDLANERLDERSSK